MTGEELVVAGCFAVLGLLVGLPVGAWLARRQDRRDPWRNARVDFAAIFDKPYGGKLIARLYTDGETDRIKRNLDEAVDQLEARRAGRGYARWDHAAFRAAVHDDDEILGG